MHLVTFHHWKNRDTHANENILVCVAEAPSHALLWLYKESVFRGLQCGDAWHGGVKLPVKPTETGKGHRQQHTWRVSLCFLTVSVLSVCVGWRLGWEWGGLSVGPYLCIFGNHMVWNSMFTCTHGTELIEDNQWVWASTKPPPPHSFPHTCTHILYIQTHNILQPHTHAHTY